MVVVEDHQQREPSMSEITTIGLDLAKNIFQVHSIDETGTAVVVSDCHLVVFKSIGLYSSSNPKFAGAVHSCAALLHKYRAR